VSWDIKMTTIVDGKKVYFGPDYNYTHNTNEMIRQAGFPEFPEVDGMSVGEFVAKLDIVLTAFAADPGGYRAMDPPNGWGSYDSLSEVLTEMVEAYRPYPSATIQCHR